MIKGFIHEVTAESLNEFAELSRQVPVILCVDAAWGDRQTSAALDKLINEHNGALVLARADADKNPALVQALQVQAAPAIFALLAGQPMPLLQGACPEDELAEILRQVLLAAGQNGINQTVLPADETPDEPPLSEGVLLAQQAEQAGDYDTAIERYREVLAETPADSDALQGLARAQLLARLAGRSMADIRAAQATVDDQLLIADLDVSGGHLEDAFGRLLELYPTCDAEDKNRIRLRLIDLFQVAGMNHPEVAAARRRLTSLIM